MEQLQLSIKELKKIGFTKEIIPATDEFNPEKAIYTIECLNGIFYCDPGQAVNRWYQRVDIGAGRNHINLDITMAPQLFTILRAFKVNHTFFVI